HAADDVVLDRHAAPVGGGRVLPREVGGDVFGGGLRHGPGLAVLLDRLLDPLLHFVRVDLGRPFVKRPEVRVDAGVGYAWRGRLDRAHGRLKVIAPRTSGRHGGEPHACFRRRRRNRVGRDRFGGGRLGGGNAGGRENGLGRARTARRGHSDGGGSG